MITSHRIDDSAKSDYVQKVFGIRFLLLESFVFDTAASLCADYDGGNWDFYTLSKGGFLMTAPARRSYAVECDNGFSGSLSAEAFGITCCLYAYSFLSFSPDETFAQSCADHFHLLRAFALQHEQAVAILRAID